MDAPRREGGPAVGSPAPSPSPLPKAGSHYFDDRPDVASARARVELWLPDTNLVLATDRGVFASDRVDAGTKLLLLSAPPLPEAGTLLDLGCGS